MRRGRCGLLLAFALAATFALSAPSRAYAADSPPEYIYGEAERELPFDIDAGSLRAIDSPSDARRVFRSALGELSPSDREDAYVLDVLTLLAEECVRRGGGDDPAAVRLDMLDSAALYGVTLPREPRLGATVSLDDARDGDWQPRDGVEHVYIDAPFATLRVDASAARGAYVQRLGEPEEPERPSVMAEALRFWGIWVIAAALAASVLIEPVRRRRAGRWATLGLCVCAAAVNLFAVTRPAAEETPEEDGVLVEFEDGAPAVLSVAPPDGDDTDLTVVGEDGAPAPCKYNPVTRAIDARIVTGGKYYLRLSAVYFTDIKDKSAEMRQAIRVLTSRGLMDGAGERSFLPDREITRAEFLSVALRVMGMLDGEAESHFPDVLRSDWFYSVAASTEKERLIIGYDDGTFRGNAPILKAQMVAVTGSALSRVMGYPTPTETEADEILREYTDGDAIADWARESVALAARAGIVPRRADGSFDSESVMTRGDAAIMLYRLFMRMW